MARFFGTAAWWAARLLALTLAVPATLSAQESQSPVPAEPTSLQRVLRGFGDVQLLTGDKVEPTTFRLGQLDFFMTSELGGALSVLVETVLEADDANVLHFELERLQLQYAPNDFFKLTAGRFHAALGYYNTAYHHGTWFQTAVGRPRLFAFEDEGGVLPIHDVGVSVTGRVPSGGLGLHYVAEVGNGRDWSSDAEPVQTAVDANDGKTILAGIHARPSRWRGAQIGGSVYRDRVTQGRRTVIETIYSAHAVLDRPEFELMVEASRLAFSENGRRRPGATFLYAQAARRFERARPYVRYEYCDTPDGTPLLQPMPREHGPSLGLRYDVGGAAALKVQFDERWERPGGRRHRGVAQVAFTF